MQETTKQHLNMSKAAKSSTALQMVYVLSGRVPLLLPLLLYQHPQLCRRLIRKHGDQECEPLPAGG